MTYEAALKVMQEARVNTPALVRFGGHYYVFSGLKVLGSGSTFEQALTAAKLLPRRKLNADEAVLFINIDRDVLRGTESVCVARSRNYAHRIANALNAYKPNKDGF